MTRDEHMHIISNQRKLIELSYSNAMKLYDMHIKHLEFERTDIGCHIAEMKLKGEYSTVSELRKEEEALTAKIRQTEIDCGLKEYEETENTLHEQLKAMIDNAKYELTEYEYYTSNIPDQKDCSQYLASHGLVKTVIFDRYSAINVYNLNAKFKEETGIEFLEGITPFMDDNNEINGIALVQYTFMINNYCTIAKDKIKNTWYVLLDDDIVFEHENLQDIFEYRNIVG